jgi:hypothetical protein
MPVSPKPDFVTRVTADEWAALPLSERALFVARSQLDAKVAEFPRGSNWGPAVSLYLRIAGLRNPAPWCAAFVYWCLVVAGADRRKLWSNPASTYSLWKWAANSGRLSPVPGRGTAFVWNASGGGHTGFVRAVLPGNVVATIEGNTNAGGSREGYEVAERKRDVLQIFKSGPRYGFIDFGGVS